MGILDGNQITSTKLKCAAHPRVNIHGIGIPGTHDAAVEVSGYCHSVLKGGGGAMGRSCCLLELFLPGLPLCNMDQRIYEVANHIHLGRRCQQLETKQPRI